MSILILQISSYLILINTKEEYLIRIKQLFDDPLFQVVLEVILVSCEDVSVLCNVSRKSLNISSG